MTAGREVDVGSLLTIDVESELRKLTQAQLQGPWQLPAELVRRALREGATAVDVELGRSFIRVRSTGGGVAYQVLRELAALLDTRRSPERRHRALSILEARGSLSLLGLVGLEPTSLQILSPLATAGGQPSGLSWKRGGEVVIQRFTPPGPTHTEVLVRGAKIDRARAREWLDAVARHAPAEIRVDGRALVGGFEDALFATVLHAPMPGTLAIPREGDVARVYLLQDGLLSTHLSVTEGPCFEVALETRALPGIAPGASAADLRDAVAGRIEAIVDAAVEQMIWLAQGNVPLSTDDRARLTQQLLQGARVRREHAKTIARLPLFRSIEVDGRERWSDLLALRQTVQEDDGERVLSALLPDQDPAEFAPEGRVYVLDESERALLAEMLDLGFRQPRRRVEPRRGLAGVFGGDEHHGRGRDWLNALRPGGRAIRDDELEKSERRFLARVREQLPRGEIAMCAGDGPVRRIGAGPDRVLLPRRSAEVRAAVTAVDRDPTWVYPALLALLGGRGFPERARRRWRFDSWR